MLHTINDFIVILLSRATEYIHIKLVLHLLQRSKAVVKRGLIRFEGWHSGIWILMVFLLLFWYSSIFLNQVSLLILFFTSFFSHNPLFWGLCMFCRAHWVRGFITSCYHISHKQPTVTWCFLLLVADFRPFWCGFLSSLTWIKGKYLTFYSGANFCIISLSALSIFVTGFWRDLKCFLNKNSSFWLCKTDCNGLLLQKILGKICLYFSLVLLL